MKDELSKNHAIERYVTRRCVLGRACSQNQPVLSSLLNDLAYRRVALGPYEALLLALHQLFQVTPHLHLLHVGAVTFLHKLLLLTQFLQPTKEKTDCEEDHVSICYRAVLGHNFLTLPSNSCSEMFFM